MKAAVIKQSAPDYHLTAGPHCGMTESGSGRVGGACRCPTVSNGIISAARVRLVVDATPAPDDHLTAGPNSRVIFLAAGRVDGGGG